MIKHIVLWKLKDHAEGADLAANAIKMKAMLDGCAGIVPGMGAFDVVIAHPALTGSTHDFALYSEFTDAAALQAYQEHPTHVAIKPFFGAVVASRACIDYEI